jgi:hypothetical protein
VQATGWEERAARLDARVSGLEAAVRLLAEQLYQVRQQRAFLRTR